MPKARLTGSRKPGRIARRDSWLLAGLLAAFAAPGMTAAAAADPVRLGVLEFSYLDTSGEPSDQAAAHAERLAGFVRKLRTDLDAGGLYEVTPLPRAALCDAGDSACILNAAREAGADIVLTGAIHKASTLISRIWAGAFDVATGKPVFRRELSFRGDTDQAWREACGFLVEQIESDPPKPL